MSAAVDSIGIIIAAIGIILLAAEFIHPGALLLIPGSILVVGGLLAVFLPDVLFNGPWGILIVLIVAVIATIIEIPYYRWVAPTHNPMTTTSAGLVGEVGTVIAPVVPDTLHGKIRVKSEVWSARSDRPIPVGSKVRIISGEGVSVRVELLADGVAG